ncbi:VOC family protein [Demequina soli]|uniref:VOC family protein n=1 Tax=Demequina soli TaxID=1638987 RepID=UPI000785DB79|nr:VOC family protein [Demequina soli]
MAHGDITHIDIPVTDLAAAQGFYSTLFGWQISAPPGFEDYPMWRAPNQISGGGLAPRDGEFTQPRSYVEVDEIDDTLALVVANGGTVTRPKSEITPTSWWAAFRDPDGNDVGLYQGITEV